MTELETCIREFSLDPGTVPKSVAIIMDGNGRWAKQRGLVRIFGHEQGAEAVDIVAETASRVGVTFLTLYAFSTENWQRPKREVSTLWKLLVRDLERRGPKCLKNGIRLRSIGRRDRMPEVAVRELDKVERATAHCDRMTLCLALDYGGTWDILQVAERARELFCSAKLPAGPLSPELLSTLLGSGIVPPVDLLIRTGGESRTSNFLPWQLNYAELMFLPMLWPEFGAKELLECFVEYSRRKRSFGRIADEEDSEVETANATLRERAHR